MKLVSDYLAQAKDFEALAAAEANPATKKQLLEQAEAYYKLAKMRAMDLDQWVPDRPPRSK